ncbi:uncharacterized protein BP01DRAFT_364752 [Aspergillus saccharolyticus JOP 1030-1]|uniref:Uncharacterized protein n=1 Tax=Aspergillus saccharolyticus JOP 1030-1 TaxID=1450539 RepID=A0A318ZGA4_9EURO|nr:hypothetical protein BP01DRAFT_364752 [Aspergillus saccharolyticus JOP 1030-1]PYH46586.1 hypothetical protein BP01DRAFT_364752 [Aspergillus saccharolyticus JOP 1030-1]
MTELRCEVKRCLQRLESLLRINGDNDISDRIREIRQASDPLISLRQLFSDVVQRRNTPTENETECMNFYRDFQSADGPLSTKQVESLTAVTKRWKLDKEYVQSLKTCAELWCKYPILFWLGLPDKEPTRRCINELQRADQIDSTKRRVLLVMLSEEVERQRVNNQTQRRRRKRADHQAKKASSYARDSVDSLCKCLYPQMKREMLKTKKSQISLYAGYGWKWSQLHPNAYVLSLPNIDINRYERKCWTWIEFEAINAFMHTLPQVEVAQPLENAWNAMTKFYRSGDLFSKGNQIYADLRGDLGIASDDMLISVVAGALPYPTDVSSSKNWKSLQQAPGDLDSETNTSPEIDSNSAHELNSELGHTSELGEFSRHTSNEVPTTQGRSSFTGNPFNTSEPPGANTVARRSQTPVQEAGGNMLRDFNNSNIPEQPQRTSQSMTVASQAVEEDPDANISAACITPQRLVELSLYFFARQEADDTHDH